MNEPWICRICKAFQSLLYFIKSYILLPKPMETIPTSISFYWSGQRDNQEINFSHASNGGIDNFH